MPGFNVSGGDLGYTGRRGGLTSPRAGFPMQASPLQDGEGEKLPDGDGPQPGEIPLPLSAPLSPGRWLAAIFPLSLLASLRTDNVGGPCTPCSGDAISPAHGLSSPLAQARPRAYQDPPALHRGRKFWRLQTIFSPARPRPLPPCCAPAPRCPRAPPQLGDDEILSEAKRRRLNITPRSTEPQPAAAPGLASYAQVRPPSRALCPPLCARRSQRCCPSCSRRGFRLRQPQSPPSAP